MLKVKQSHVLAVIQYCFTFVLLQQMTNTSHHEMTDYSCGV
jgi:hypothetical protein